MALVIWHIQNSQANPIIALVEGNGIAMGTWQAMSNKCGDCVTELGPDSYLVTVSSDGYQTRSINAEIRECGIITIGLDKVPVSTTIVPIACNGPIFITAERSEAWRWKFVTAFKLLQRFANNEDVNPFLNSVRSMGANGVRIFCQHAYLDSHPPHWPARPWQAQLSKIREFCDHCARGGMYVEVTMLCDCQVINPNSSDQIDRVADIIDVLIDAPNVFLEICNEPNDNGCDPVYIANSLNLFAHRSHLMSLGLYPITGMEPDFPVLDYVGDHPPRKTDWTIECGKIGFYQYEQTGAVCISDEPPKFSEPNADPEATEQNPESSPVNAEDAGGGYGIGSAGATFHCRNGIDGLLFGQLETECARRFFAAMDWFPANAFTGHYSHDGRAGHGLAAVNNPMIVGEVVSRTLGNVQWCAAAMPSDKWNPIAINGWKIADRSDGRGVRIKLTR